jgi:hypothetical protein
MHHLCFQVKKIQDCSIKAGRWRSTPSPGTRAAEADVVGHRASRLPTPSCRRATLITHSNPWLSDWLTLTCTFCSCWNNCTPFLSFLLQVLSFEMRLSNNTRRRCSRSSGSCSGTRRGTYESNIGMLRRIYPLALPSAHGPCWVIRQILD